MAGGGGKSGRNSVVFYGNMPFLKIQPYTQRVVMNDKSRQISQTEIPGFSKYTSVNSPTEMFFFHKKNMAYRKKKVKPIKRKLMENGESNFSLITKKWMENASAENKQSLGQFMSPKPLREYLLNQLNIKNGDKVLDPSVGTGEFLNDVKKRCPGVKLYGWDIDKNILEYAKKLVPAAKLSNISSLSMPEKGKYDFVIGNPPYFQLKLDNTEKTVFREVISGRPNIFALFFKVGIEALKPGGELAYIVPPSMNAGAYFQNLRKFITHENHVKHLKIFKKTDFFYEAQTSVQIIVIKKCAGISQHSYVIEDCSSGKELTLLTENAAVEQRKFRNHVSLHRLGFKAVTGPVIWNKNKNNLTNEKKEHCAPLLYARNIVNNEIVLSQDDRRPQYIKTDKLLKGKAIIVNRITGSVGNGILKCAMVKDGFVFAAENHLNVIMPSHWAEQKISIEELFKIINNEKFIETAMSITGNTQLSASEWNYFVPMTINCQER